MKFKFLNKKKKKPENIIILGSSGIISKNLQKRFRKNKIKFQSIGRSKLDLRKVYSIPLLKRKIQKADLVIFISAEAPTKNIKMLKNNLKMCKNICKALRGKYLSNLVYISSDAVYSDSKKKITEKSKTKPDSFHGKMHLKREWMLRSNFQDKICIIRPTLIYGPGDTHNGYGPNQFLNLAKRKKNISIFGNGEEKRDHIYIENVISIIMECILKKGRGIINAATGKTYTFKKIALIMNKLLKNDKSIKKIERKGPMPHNGYRPFDVKLLKKNFKNIELKNLESGVKNYILCKS